MAGRLKNEIKQRKPFGSLEEEVFLNLQRTADALIWRVGEALKPSDLTPTQYNVLRILRGAGDDGLACRELADRMVTRDPDVTRLLDRMEARGLVARSREQKDRRVITARVTDAGLRLVGELDEPIAALLVAELAHVGRERLEALSELLETARRVES